MLRIGQRIPQATICELDALGGVRAYHTEQLFSGVKAVVVGVPGAFTPVCTNKHLPPFIAEADRLKRAGFAHVICLCTSDPFALDAWARQVDPERKLRFMSDGNLDFTRAAELLTYEETFFLGQRSKRYAMTLENAIVTRLSIEPSVLEVTCTSVDDVVLD